MALEDGHALTLRHLYRHDRRQRAGGCHGIALAGLVRTRVGPFALDSAVTWDEVRQARNGETLWPRLLPPDAALAGLPPVRLDADGARAFAHGPR